MANTIKTVITYTLNGSTREFNIPFEYLARKFISVTLIGVDRKTLTLNTDYRFASRTVISLNRAWGSADGYTTIEFRRYTSASERLVDFTDGSILRAYDLNVAQVQTMHVAEEARDLTADTIGVNNDGQLDARGRRIVNVADPVDDYDALNLRTVKVWNESALNSATRSEAARNSSWSYSQDSLAYRNDAYAYMLASQDARNSSQAYSHDSLSYRNDSHTYMVAAQTASTDALTYRNDGWQYQDWAKGYKESAEASASSAASQADRAKTEADKLGNMNGLAGALWFTNGPDVVWRGLQRAKSFQYCNDDGTILFNTITDGTHTLYLRPEASVNNPIIDAASSSFRSREFNATGGVVRWTGGGREFNMTLNDGTLNMNRKGVDWWGMNGLKINGVEDLTSNIVRATSGLSVGSNNVWVGTDGNLTGPIWANGSLKGELNTKCTYADLNTKVDNGVAYNKYLVDVAHGAQTANPLNNHQGGWEVAAGHSLVGFFSTVNDGNIRYTNWISRCLVKRTEGSGWIQCGNIS